MPVLGQGMELLMQHLGQAEEAAQAQLLADLRGELLAVLALLRLLAFQQQVADIQQVQEPALGGRLHPAAQVQGLPASP